MLVNKIHALWIICAIACATVWNSLKILWKTFWHKCSRSYVNHIAFTWSKQLLHILRVSYKVVVPHDLHLQPDQCYIIMSNHVSHLDIPLIFVSFPHNSVRMMAKKELFRVPIWGNCIKCSEFISIDRHNRRQAVLDLRIAQQKMQTGIIPWIAPEGTRSRSGALQPFKKGGFMLALQTKATIIPVGIQGSGRVLPAGTLNFSTGEKVTINIGEPIATKQYTVKDLAILMQRVEESIRHLSAESAKML